MSKRPETHRISGHFPSHWAGPGRDEARCICARLIHVKRLLSADAILFHNNGKAGRLPLTSHAVDPRADARSTEGGLIEYETSAVIARRKFAITGKNFNAHSNTKRHQPVTARSGCKHFLQTRRGRPIPWRCRPSSLRLRPRRRRFFASPGRRSTRCRRAGRFRRPGGA